MSLSKKVLVTLLVVLTVYVATDYAIQRFVVYPSFVSLEREEAIKDLERASEAILREIEHLGLLCHDWAAWDDSYEYIADRNSQYAENNFTASTYTDAELNVLFYCDRKGEVVFGAIRDVDFTTEVPLAAFPPQALPPDHFLLDHKSTQSEIGGLLLTERGPLLVSSMPIITSENEGPIRGTLIMGRFLSEDVVAMLVEQTRVAFRVWPVGSENIPPDDRLTLERITPGKPTLVRQIGDRMLAVSAVLPDINDQPALLMRADVPRDISAKGTMAMRAAMVSLGAAGLITLLVLIVTLQRLVVGPVAQLTAHATRIGGSADLTTRLNLRRGDEIGVLANEFDDMVGKLAESRAQLTEASRYAGMAEVASGVLHNVGNVLNGVNVTASTMTTRVRQSKVDGLTKAVRLMQAHDQDLARFITEDERGKVLPKYLTQVTERLAAEQGDMLGRLETLSKQIEHVNQIVQAQQSYARCSAPAEPTSLSELPQHAVTMLEASFARHHVKLERELAELPTALVDRATVLQVLVNLLTNAKNAVRSQEDKRVTLRLRAAGDGRFAYEVHDNGPGIAPENFTRIFADGFTTKKGGRGYGLHYSSLAAKQMGGELRVHSDGPGTGATFTLELPLRTVTEQETACPATTI